MILLRVILFLVIIYWVLKFVFRLFGGIFISNLQKEFNRQQQSQQQYGQQQRHRDEEGKVRITHRPQDDKKHVQGGDYVDFEEVE